MNKEQKEKLKNALREVNAPDKQKLLDRIEQRKNFASDFAQEGEYIEKKKRKNVIAKTVLVFSLAVCIIFVASFLTWIDKTISDEIYQAQGGTVVDGERYEDNINSWKVKYDGYISFDDVDMSYDEFCEQNGIDGLLPLFDGWSVTRTQITQDEGAFREYRTDGSQMMEFTVFVNGHIPSLDTRYAYFLKGESKVYADGKVWYASNLILKGSDYEYAYVYYGKDAIYCVYSSCKLAV